MCDVDIGVFGSVWVNQTHPRPFVDFNTKHVCRNFDDIRTWVKNAQVPEGKLAEFMEEEPGEEVKVWDEAP
jgi:hypothetical protein